ncbi:MAG: hypothetical protein E6J90_29360 [Deltaproteobacteria bacterium]|nr:MAG: hypothetical protein E6J90_29360 [Deltaproteobacteria bacterium]
MSRLVLVVLITLAATVEGAPDRVDAAIQALPVLGTVAHGRARIVVRGEVTAARARDAMALVDLVVGDVQRRFTARARTPDRDITLCLLPDDARLRAVALAAFGDTPSDLGFYRPDHRVALANLGNSIGNLRHELVHPLLGDDFPQIPAWLNEGIAALYGSARAGKRGFEFLVNYRLRDLQKALKAGDLPTVDQLAASTADDVRGPRAMTWYAMARYVLLYLDRAGKLGELYARLRGAADDTDAQRTILTAYVDDAAFRRWAAALRL